MEENERHLIRRMAWFRPNPVFLDRDLRLPSLPSVELMDLIGLDLFREDPGLEPEEEWARVQAYAWIHSEKVPVVMAALWSGDWRELLRVGEIMPEVIRAGLEEWRCYREPLRQLMEAADFTVKPKPKPKSAAKGPAGPTPPSNLIHCTVTGHRIVRVMQVLGLSDPLALWDLPWWEAMAIYHADRRHDDLWTVPKAKEREVEDFEGFGLGGIDTPAES